MPAVSQLCLARGCQRDAEMSPPPKRAAHGGWERQEVGAAGTSLPQDQGISVPVHDLKLLLNQQAALHHVFLLFPSGQQHFGVVMSPGHGKGGEHLLLTQCLCQQRERVVCLGEQGSNELQPWAARWAKKWKEG